MRFFCKKNAVDTLLSKAMLGDPQAQFDLAERYYHGQDVEQDVFRAIHWYGYAAANGHEEAVEIFDRLYFHGKNTQNKLMGFWFERECLTHTFIPASIPFELRPIAYRNEDDKDKALKATIPWSRELREIMGDSLNQYSSLSKRTLIEVSLSEGYLFDPSRRGGVAAGDVLSGNPSQDIRLMQCAIDVAVKMNLLATKEDAPLQLVDFHKMLAKCFCDALQRQEAPCGLETMISFAFLKGMEQRVACSVYSNTQRHSCYNFYPAIEECMAGNFQSFATDLPNHLTKEIRKQLDLTTAYARAVVQSKPDIRSADDLQCLLLTVAVVGDSWATRCCVDRSGIKDYSNADMLTMDEIRKIAGDVFIRQVLLPDGAEILNRNFNRDFQANVLAEIKGERRAYIVRAAVYPEQPAFLPFELDRLYEGARNNGFIPYFVSVLVASANERHFSDGVILIGDETKAMIAACNKLEREDEQ